MKHLALVLVSLVMSSVAMAYDGGEQDEDNGQYDGPTLVGTWRTERPFVSHPNAIATGEVTFTNDSITFETTCSYNYGPVVKATVTSEIEYHENHFYVPRSVQVREEEYGYTCDAYLGQGRYGFSFYGDDKVVLFNRAHNWRMVLIR